jgi:predicted transcriptional regulator
MVNAEAPAADREQLLVLAARIVAAQATNSQVTTDQLPALIQSVFEALATAKQKAMSLPRPEPGVPVRRSIRPDHLVCLDCGKHLSMLKRHLRIDHELSPEDYRRRWGLPGSYPMVAPAYAKV